MEETHMKENPFIDISNGTTSGSLIDYYDVREEADPFTDVSSIDTLDNDGKEDINAGIPKMLEEAKENSIPTKKSFELRNFVSENIYLFRTPYSSDALPKVQSVAIVLTDYSRPVRVRLHNYLQEKRALLA